MSTNTLRNTFGLLGDGDGVLLTQDAILCLRHGESLALLSQLKRVFALRADVEALAVAPVPDFVSVIDYSEMVELVVHFDKSLTW